MGVQVNPWLAFAFGVFVGIILVTVFALLMAAADGEKDSEEGSW